MRPVGLPASSGSVPALPSPDMPAPSVASRADHFVEQSAAHSAENAIPNELPVNGHIVTVGSFTPLAKSEDKVLLAAMLKPRGPVEGRPGLEAPPCIAIQHKGLATSASSTFRLQRIVQIG